MKGLRIRLRLAVAAGLTLSLLRVAPAHAQPRALPPGQQVALPGVRLWYYDTGSQPGQGGRRREAVVFLHANTGTGESWSPQFDAFARAGYRAIAFDRRGWGQSAPDPATGPQPGTIAEDLQALVEYLKVDRFHLVAVAGGTFAALDYAAWHGERLLSLVAGASQGAIRDEPMRTYVANITIPGLNQGDNVRFLELSPAYRGSNPEGVKEWLELHHRSQQPNAPAQGQRTPNTLEKIQGIKVRTLILPGEADLLAPPDLMRKWGVYIKNAEWAVVPDAGHSINWENPDAFNATVLRFLKGERFEKVARVASKP